MIRSTQYLCQAVLITHYTGVKNGACALSVSFSLFNLDKAKKRDACVHPLVEKIPHAGPGLWQTLPIPIAMHIQQGTFQKRHKNITRLKDFGK